jgi:hypothetical protein
MHLRLAVALMVAMVGGAQEPAPKPNPVPMPQDRAADSYEIYSVLLGQGLKNSSSTTRYGLVGETTTAGAPPTRPCHPDFVSPPPLQGMIWTNPPQTATPTPLQARMMVNNPHYAKPPAGHELEFREVLDDFDLHCHERVTLSADGFHTAVPVHLADEAMKKRFVALRDSPAKADAKAAAEFDAVGSITSFSEVFFNPSHTLALVNQNNWCSKLCGTRGWVILERKEGRWKQRGYYGWTIS